MAVEEKHYAEPHFPKKIGNVDLESRLVQELEIPLEFEGRDFTIYVRYDYKPAKNMGERVLDISVHDIPTPTEVGPGLGARFRNDGYGEVKGHNDYHHNEKVAAFFVVHILPSLKASLPEYMKKLILEADFAGKEGELVRELILQDK